MGLPLQVLPLPSQRYSCHGCGDCCRDFTVQLADEDRERLDRQRWTARLGEPVTVEFRGAHFLRQRPDGACIFLRSDGLCGVHAEFGFDEKPLACRIFPFTFAPRPREVRVGVSFACQSVRENRGASLPSHIEDLERFRQALPEANRPSVVRLAGRMEATLEEIQAVESAVDGWLSRPGIAFDARLDGLAWCAQQLMAATLERVRGERFGELVTLLVGVLPGELELRPIGAPTKRQRSLLRQAVFARTEDPKLGTMRAKGRFRTVLSQLSRSRRFSRGRGEVPAIGATWPRGATFEGVERCAPAAAGAERAEIESLIGRWLRATTLGGRAWGSGFYGWPIVDGLAALAVNLAAVGWLSRAHAVASGGRAPGIADARAALGRIDRSAGRAPWLGGGAERLRVEYLSRDDGLRRLVREAWFGAPIASDRRA